MADITVEKTLALIKPDAMNWADEIIEEIKRNGFKILQVNLMINRTNMIYNYWTEEKDSTQPRRSSQLLC